MKSNALKKSTNNKDFFVRIPSMFRRIVRIWIVVVLYSHLHVHSASQRHNTKDRCMKDNAWRKTQEDFFTNIHHSLYFKGSKGLFKGFHVRGCWRLNINFIFWSHCYDRHVVSCSPDVGVCSIGAFRAPPPGRVWPSLPHLVSSSLGVCWQLHRGFSECPLGRVWPSLPHLVSTVWNSTGNCFWDPNSTELNNNSTPTRSPTGSLKSNV